MVTTVMGPPWRAAHHTWLRAPTAIPLIIRGLLCSSWPPLAYIHCTSYVVCRRRHPQGIHPHPPINLDPATPKSREYSRPPSPPVATICRPCTYSMALS
ncbi:hypothetical protein LZ31DRAFT_353826 [Colletotrichum somersetense]|nr:hypothetical protein LZ31DRAFT_353826 [Colletotrichum somersetense]